MDHTLDLKKIEQESMSKKINQVEPNINSEDIQSVNEYMSSGAWITENKKTEEFENLISKFVGRSYGVAVPNGTIAIYLSLISAGLTEGKKVAVPNITMIATINAVIWAGATPVIVDINERLCMSIESLKTINDLDGVIYVPLNGRTEDGLEIKNYCDKNNIKLVEDSAHALGSKYENVHCGSIGDLSVFSFTPHKIITMGQGGMILTDSEKLYNDLINIKTFNRSKDKSDWHEGFGLNFKITDLQAALGISQFRKIQDFIKKKKHIFDTYKKNIEHYDLINFNPSETPWFIDLISRTPEERIKLSEYLDDRNIVTRDSYPALSFQKFLRKIEKSNLTYSENISNRILWLPSSTMIKDEEIKTICGHINNFFENN